VMVAPSKAPINLPLAFDTGSSGLTVNARSVFPPGVLTATGFVFPSSKKSIVDNTLARSIGALASPLSSKTSVMLVKPSGFPCSYTTEASSITRNTIGPTVSTGIGVDFFTKIVFY
jgi:hypothetical protein